MNGMCKLRFARCLIWALALCLLAGAALAEVERGDLEERFSDVPRMEYDGATYYLRDRLTVILVAGIMPDDAGVPVTDFAAVFAIDDNEKRITPIYIDGQTLVACDGAAMPLREVYALGADPDEGMLRLAEAVDGVLGGELITSYMGVDLDGISAVTELGVIEGDARQRLHLLRVALEVIPAKQLNELYGRISKYLTTDMKSGAVMRAIDKSDRYEIADTLDLPVLPGEGAQLQPDGDAIQRLVIDIFYETDLF